jgi:hypothetical protein
MSAGQHKLYDVNTTTEETTTHTTRPSVTARLAAARRARAVRRTEAAARRHLAAELAGYARPADRNDLNALLDTYPDTQALEIRELLNRRVTA